MTKTNDSIEAVRCIFALNQRALDSKVDDLTLIKEAVKLSSGKEYRRIRLVENVMRPYYVVKKGLQVYRDKRENESLDNLDKYECTQAALPIELNRKLNYVGGENPRLAHLNRSQFVYGTDVDVTTIVNHDVNTEYDKLYPMYRPDARRAMFDLETDVIHGHGRILMGTLCFDKDIYLAVTEDFTKGIDDYGNLLLKFANKTIGKLIEERGLKLKVKVVPKDIDVVRSLFSVAHKLKPDFMCIWNMTFDIPKVIEACERNNVNPADIFCDPSIPPRYRRFKWNESQKSRVKADGKKMNFDPTDLWHSVQCLASFQIIDAMCLFRTIRSMEQMRNTYSLDSVLKDYTDIEKLKWDGADHLKSSSIEWHRFMQNVNDDSNDIDNRLAYGVYCPFDGIAMTILDDKTKDICVALMVYIGYSQIQRIKSNPKRLCDAYHFYLLEEHGRVICGTSDDMKEEFDSLLLGRNDWIITLPNFNVVLESKEIFKPGFEAFNKLARIYRQCYDVDIKSSYPSNQLAANVSRDTTLCEVLHFDGVPESEQRRLSVNMTNVPANALNLGECLFSLPKIVDWEAEFENDFGISA